jgi:hypothetical protein
MSQKCTLGARPRDDSPPEVAAGAFFDYRGVMSRTLHDASRPGRFDATAAAGRALALIRGLLLLRLART